MNIVQVITELKPAGAERVVADLSLALNSEGHTVTVVALLPLPLNRAIVDELEAGSIEVCSLNVSKSSPWRIFKLAKLLKIIDPDIVHSHLIHANLTARVNSILGGKYLLFNSVHIAERRPSKWWHFLCDRLTGKLCTCQSAVSKAVRDFHCSKTNRSADSMPVIYNGIATPDSLSEEEVVLLKDEWGVLDCDILIGSIGRLEEQKGYDTLLRRIMPELSTRLGERSCALVIVGEGSQRVDLEQLASKLPKNIKVVLPGYRKDAASCISAFDLFLMPSRYEGFGLALAEAMCHGMPLLASDVDSLPELLENYSNGETVDFEKGSLEETVEKMLFWVGKARVGTCGDFSIEKMATSYMNLYKSFMEC